MTSGTLPLVIRVFVIIVVVIGIYKFFFADDSPTRKLVFINRELGIAGEVTGFDKARGYKIYLNSSDTPYNFDNFENAQLLPNTSLGYYLKHGDQLKKEPNTAVIFVKRKGQISEWYLVKPEAQP